MSPAEVADRAALPGAPPPALQRAYGALSYARRAAMLPHLTGDTSSEYLADWLGRAGHPVGSRTIRRYRRSLAREEVCK